MTGCTKVAPSSEISLPIADNIPYPDYDYKVVSNRPISAEEDWPRTVVLLKDFLAGEATLERDTLGLDHSGDVDLELLPDGRLVVLDLLRTEMTELDPQSGELHRFALQGDGPGELQFPQGLARIESRIFLARADKRISVFDCGNGQCEYERSVETGFAANAIGISVGGGLATLPTEVVGQIGLNRIEHPGNANPPAVTLLDFDGRTTARFGERYDTEGYWMLARPFNSQAAIRYLPAAHRYVLVYDPFPFVYVYSEDGELTDGYRLDGFETGEWIYDTEKGRLSVPTGDVSTIAGLTGMGGGVIILEVVHRTNNRVAEGTRYFDARKEFVAMDVRSGRSALVGSLTGDESHRLPRRIFLGDGRLIVNTSGQLVVVTRPER